MLPFILLFFCRVLPLHDSHLIFTVKFTNFQKEISAIRHWYEKEHRNWIPIDAERSKWWVWNRALAETRNIVRHIQDYVERTTKGKERISVFPPSIETPFVSCYFAVELKLK